ncbi:26S proteasome complex subunit SEM1-like [Tetranychus urticae]|uniref:26S proteasome complex subunit SEM1 n=1 Tax=Tetranychus urticae TaxID=32264 RepID=T1KVQ5_TETUR|nr:26S proteasome complex subunit SEM1-like [Tetranychus urticae]
MSNNQQPQNFKKDTTNKSKIDLGFEEDDEFEEFPAEEWNEKDSDQEFTIWDDNWDDDDMKDDFSMQLKSELEKQKLV